MIRLFRTALLIGFAVVLVMQSAASAATVGINIVSTPSPGAFSPMTADLHPGDTAKWTNTTFNVHTTTGDAPLSFWDSGDLLHNQTFSKVFLAAGHYTYHCTVHPTMTGVVHVGPVVTPSSGTTSTTFLIMWASGSIPSGYEEDLILKRPNSTRFAAWMVGQSGTEISHTFVPDAGTGKYVFAARIRQLVSGSPASDWAAVAVQVS